MLDLILSMNSNAVLIFDEYGRIIRANHVATDVFGYSVSELVGKDLSLLLRAQDVDKHRVLFNDFINNTAETYRMSMFRSAFALHKDGTVFPIDASIGKTDYEGRKILVAVVRSDDAERRAEELSRSIALFPQENPNPVFRIKETGEILFTNIVGEKLLREIPTETVHSAPEEWVEISKQALKANELKVELFNYQGKVYSFSFVPIRDMGYINLYCQDITETESERNRLALSDEILSAIGNLVLVANSNAEIVYISPSVKQIIGYEPDEILGDGWWEMERISGGDVLVEKEYIRNVASGRTVADGKPYEHRVRHKDGSWRWLMLADAKGPRDLVIGIGTDITEIKKAELELQKQRDFAQTLTNQMGQGLTVMTDDRRFEFVNPSYARMLGYQPFDLIGKSVVEVLDSQYHEVAQNALKLRLNGEVTTYEAYLQCADGTRVFTLINSAPRFIDGKYAGSIDVITDLTERIQVENTLRSYTQAIEKSNIDLAEARDRALEASYLKSTFLSTMSHEIRTPMNAILGMTELLLDTDLNEEQMEFARVIDSSTHSLLGILNDVLDFSKIEAGKLSIQPVLFNPTEVVQDTVKLFTPKAQEKNINFSVMVTSAIPNNLIGDAGRIRQILSNLVSNAVKFTDEQGCVFINISGTPIGNNKIMTTFSVQDNGVGIPLAVRSKLFEPFMQADGSQVRKYGGSGLGLAISKRLVDLMHGEIGFESVEGTGSTFWFSLPLDTDYGKVDASSEKMAFPQIKKYKNYSHHKPVLLVEDNLVNRDLFTLQLAEFGLHVKHAGNGRQALELLQVDPDSYSLVLMDLHMPEMDGFTATRAIRTHENKSNRHIPIIAITANAMMESQELCLNAGMDDYLSKPISLAGLATVLEKWLKEL
ncbi:MAG: PAS domain S-box protein [Anaerolineales bacterium]